MSCHSNGGLRGTFLCVLALIYFILQEESINCIELEPSWRVEQSAAEIASTYKVECESKICSRFRTEELPRRRMLPSWDAEKQLKLTLSQVSPLLAISAEANEKLVSYFI